MRPIAPNVIWALDFQFDQTSDLRTVKLLNIIDEFTRECLTIDVGRSITAFSDGCCTPIPIEVVHRFRRSCTPRKVVTLALA
jgi:hypothetical protein